MTEQSESFSSSSQTNLLTDASSISSGGTSSAASLPSSTNTNLQSTDSGLIASLLGNYIHHTEVIWHVHNGEYGPLHFARYTP